MLISARAAVALRCPQCGRTAVRELSLFDFSGAATVRVDCACGYRQATISRWRGRVLAQIPCYLCEGMHQLRFTPAQFWAGELEPVTCQESGLHLGVLGPPEAVAQFTGPDSADLDEDALADYFINPEVMYEVLAAVHELDEQGRLRCQCGNTDIEYELQPDRLDLVCTQCGSSRSMTATSDEDATRARRTRRLEIEAAGQSGRGRRGK